MARTITVTDEDSGVVTTIVVTKDDQGYRSVKEIRFTTLNGGGGLETLDLSILRDFGLTERAPALPAPVSVPEQEPEPAAEEKPPTRRRRAAKSLRRKTDKAAGKASRQYRRAPNAEELKRLFAEHGGPSAVARALDVPQHSVAGWLRRYRQEGHVFETVDA